MRDQANQKRLITALLAAAIFAAPFLALLVRVEAGLAVMAAGLTATGFVLRDAIPAVSEELQPRLRLLVACNLVLAMLCLAALGLVLLG